MAGGSPETGGRGGEKRGGQELWRCRASHPCPQHSTGRDAGKQRIAWGKHSPPSALVCSPLLYSRARQAAAMGRKEHSTVRGAFCPGRPCQVLTKT